MGAHTTLLQISCCGSYSYAKYIFTRLVKYALNNNSDGCLYTSSKRELDRSVDQLLTTYNVFTCCIFDLTSVLSHISTHQVIILVVNAIPTYDFRPFQNC